VSKWRKLAQDLGKQRRLEAASDGDLQTDVGEVCMVGWGARGGQQKILEFIHAWRITAAMPNMDNDQLITANVVVDEESITRRWNHANAGNPSPVRARNGQPAAGRSCVFD
jgi:hypothetical protein